MSQSNLQLEGVEVSFCHDTFGICTILCAATRSDRPPGDIGGYSSDKRLQNSIKSSSFVSQSGQHYGNQINTNTPYYGTRKRADGLLQSNNFFGDDSEKDNVPTASLSAKPAIMAQNKTSSPRFNNSSQQTERHWSLTTRKEEADKAIPNVVYDKLCYAVLIGDTVKVCNTKLYASLPQQNKYLVKERSKDHHRVKLVLKSSSRRYIT